VNRTGHLKLRVLYSPLIVLLKEADKDTETNDCTEKNDKDTETNDKDTETNDKNTETNDCTLEGNC